MLCPSSQVVSPIMLGVSRLVITSLVALLALLIMAPFHLIGMAIGGRAASALTPLWHHLVLRLIGVNVTVSGAPSEARPLLLLSNHVSWLDISVLGATAPVSFIAKKEVATWPFFSWLAKLQRTVFIDRERRQSTGSATREVAHRLASGDIMVLFAEGTSGDGNTVLPFRSSLIGAAQRALRSDVRDGEGDQDSINAEAADFTTIQPVAIAYRAQHGLPLGRQHRPLVAWYGDMPMVPHLGRILAEGAIDVYVSFGEPYKVTQDMDRKALALEMHKVVRDMVAAINSGGRLPDQRQETEPELESSATEKGDAPLVKSTGSSNTIQLKQS